MTAAVLDILERPGQKGILGPKDPPGGLARRELLDPRESASRALRGTQGPRGILGMLEPLESGYRALRGIPVPRGFKDLQGP